MLANAFARASGSSKWFRGGIVAYSATVKYDVLDVPHGPVVSEVAALAMARGVDRLLDADVAVAVTEVGGPDSQDGEPPGAVWAATWSGQLGGAILLRLWGHRKASASRCARRQPECSGSASKWWRPVPEDEHRPASPAMAGDGRWPSRDSDFWTTSAAAWPVPVSKPAVSSASLEARARSGLAPDVKEDRAGRLSRWRGGGPV